MSERTIPLFLERSVYRRRRLIDAAKLIPLLAMVLFLIPALLSDPTDPGQTASLFLYFFFIWLSLIAVFAVTSRALSRADGEVQDRSASGRET